MRQHLKYRNGRENKWAGRKESTNASGGRGERAKISKIVKKHYAQYQIHYESQNTGNGYTRIREGKRWQKHFTSYVKK